MAIVIDYDTTRLPMGSLEWISLLAAIEAAAPEDESDWIEWKSTLDLTDKNHLAHIAKAIIAFAKPGPRRSVAKGRGARTAYRRCDTWAGPRCGPPRPSRTR